MADESSNEPKTQIHRPPRKETPPTDPDGKEILSDTPKTVVLKPGEQAELMRRMSELHAKEGKTGKGAGAGAAKGSAKTTSKTTPKTTGHPVTGTRGEKSDPASGWRRIGIVVLVAVVVVLGIVLLQG